jgi:hypothetical protein
MLDGGFVHTTTPVRVPLGWVVDEIVFVGACVLLAKQACRLQACVLMSVGQLAPPLDGFVVTVRDRVCEPMPHVTLQDPKEPQLETAQSTGEHAAVLHDWTLLSVGQLEPPLVGYVVTVRVCVWLPPPHVTLHDPNEPQLETAQLTLGQDCVKQDCVPSCIPEHTVL